MNLHLRLPNGLAAGHAMLIVRDAQRLLMDVPRRQRFEASAIELVRTYQPEDADRLGLDGVRALITPAIRTAGRYDLTRACDACGILMFMVAFGQDFDAQPQFHWLETILDNPWLASEAKIEECLREWSRRQTAAETALEDTVATTADDTFDGKEE